MKDVLLACLAIVNAIAADDLPSFSWDGTSLEVKYANGEMDKANMINVVEEETDNEEDATCIMFGKFEVEDIPVSLTGCPGDMTFDIVFNSKNTADSVFEVRDGVVKEVSEEEPGVAIDDEDAQTVVVGDADRIIYIDDPEIRKLLERTDVEDRDIPTEFEVTLSLRYDNLFLQNVAGGSHSVAKTKVHSVVNLARPYFEWPSLGNKISLKIVEVGYVNEYLQLGSNPGGTLGYAETLTAKNPITADNYHYFSYDTKSGTAGIARGISFGGGKGSGNFCLPEKWKDSRTAISEWMESDAKTSLTFAHELGHSLGMPHDFCSDSACKQTTERNYGRPDSYGSACWGNSIMDYYQPTVNKWSRCSKEQVAVWAKDIVKIAGKHCKDTSPPACEDLCPGSRCTLSVSDLCQNPSSYGGCNGNNKKFFDEFCKKSCNICTGTSTAPAPVVPKPKPASCEDKCPGAECSVSPNTICQSPSSFGGCSGGNAYFFNKYCQKSCGKC